MPIIPTTPKRTFPDTRPAVLLVAILLALRLMLLRLTYKSAKCKMHLP